MPALGFAVVVLLLGPILALVAQRRWRQAEARRAEVMRLALLAAEEAAWAEEEALRVGYARPVPVPDVGGGGLRIASVCAVCHSPTTTRCSRCKAVRYCSGKCQIIHWRQGHKNECFPSRVDNYYNGQAQVSITKLKGTTAPGPDMFNDHIDNGSPEEPVMTLPKKLSSDRIINGPQKESVMTLSKKLSSESSYSSEAFSDDEFIDSSGTDTSDSSDSLSSSSSMFSGPVSSFNDTSSTLDPSLPHEAGTRKHLFSDVSHDKLRTVEQKGSSFSSKEVKCSPFGSKLIDSGSCSNLKTSKDASGCENIIVGSSRSLSAKTVDSTESKIYKENQFNHSDVRSHLQASKLSDEAISSQTKPQNGTLSGISSLSGAAQTDSTGSKVSINESAPLGNSKSYSVQLVKSKSLMSSSPKFVEQASPSGHFVSDHASRKVENPPKVPINLYQNAVSHSNDIKTSVQRVVQQLKLSKISRQHRSSFGNDLSKKTKMLFPYEFFVKLYNFDKMVLRPSGLINFQNSCYANVVLQCLMFTPPLAAFLLQRLHSKTCPKRDWCFTCELENLLVKAKLEQSPLSPARILSHIHKIGSNLGHGREEDAHEFLRYAIDAMQSVCLKEAGAHTVDRWAEETTLIQLTFGGYIRSKIECMKCHSKSETYERMMDLNVEIVGSVGTLEEALRKFTSTEILDGENKYKCLRCKSYERAKKKLTVVDAPNILTIALKRYQSGKFGKINKAIHFPENLDLAPYMRGSSDKPPWYKLYAVVVHLDVMNAAFSGHYVCYVKNRQGKWYKTDDTTVTLVDLEQVLSKNAYMLFYARCSPHPSSLITGALPPDQVASRRSRSKEAFCSGYDRQKLSTSTVTTTPDLPADNNRYQDEPNRTIGYRFSYEPYDLYNGIFHFPKADSSSDSSSLFSCSDEGSCSTESTRNSTSTDDYSEYIFGDLDRKSWNSPLRFSNDLDGTISSPLYSTYSAAASCTVDSVAADRAWDTTREQYLQDGSSTFLYSDPANQCSQLTEHRSRETSGINPSKVKSSLLRRSSTTREKTTGSFY
ncbi:ubiquitin carboxyl-terminal hydrolase 17-like [Canna indica]|uniref:ubiquitinyl hydrolase 1 n=1 Tax=Canna indica TaxID=4628 RepID=A0AAQ3JRM2_9LILI|nr:ubiquitin carboxyl-terminal hydrolase 17-like [Canna indica]